MTLIKLPPEVTSHNLRPPEAEAIVKAAVTTAPPSASFLLLTDDVLSSQKGSYRTSSAEALQILRVQRSVKQPLGWRAGEPGSGPTLPGYLG